MLRRRFEEITSAELAARGAQGLRGAVAVLPVAAVEQHGAHLPLGTDAIIADAMAAAAVARLPADLEAVFLPVRRIGTSDEHASFPGTLSLDWRTGAQTLIRLGEGAARAGFRRLAIVSSHGGNTQVAEIAALELRRRLGMLAAHSSWMRFGLPDGAVPAEEAARGVHGGAVETALMLHIRPDLVRAEAVADCPSLQTRLEGENRFLRAHGRLGFAWMAEDLNPGGTVGDARLGSAEAGARILAHQAGGFVRYLGELAALELPAARLPPSRCSVPELGGEDQR